MVDEDRKQFRILYEKYMPELLRYAKRWLDNYLAEDVVEETFLIVWKNIGKLRIHSSPRKWLYVTLNHKCLHETKRKSYQLEIPYEFEKATFQVSPDNNGIFSILPAGLSKEEIKLLTWRYEEQYEFSEIADRLGIKEGAARKRVFRAVEHCRILIMNPEETVST